MNLGNKCLDRLSKCEEKVSKHINIIGHFDNETLIDKSGKLIRIFKLQGMNASTKSDELIDQYKNRRNNLLKNFSSEYAFYFWEVRRKVNVFCEGKFKQEFAKTVNDKYKSKIQNSAMYQNDLYLAIITKHPEGFINKSFNFIDHFIKKVDRSYKQEYLRKRHQDIKDASQKILSAFSDYGCELLSVYEKNSIQFSAPLQFLSQLINIDPRPIPLNIANAGEIIPYKRLSFNRRLGAIEFRASNNTAKFAAVLSIKGYSEFTESGMLDRLADLKCEYILTQSFRFLDAQVAKNKMRDQQNEMLQSKDESVSQVIEIDKAFDDASSGRVSNGIHHLTLTCFADDLEELDQNIGKIISKFSEIDIICVREDIACEAAFLAQLPGNFQYILRPATISTKNLASFVSFHNQPRGKRTGNHWGDAVTVFQTITGSPYYFNFHYKDVGNFLVFGPMGSGKTLLIGFLILQSMKFGGKRIIFDKDRGLEIAVRASHGIYEQIKPGMKTSFNPCQLEDTKENRHFLFQLFRRMLSSNNNQILTEEDHEIIIRAIDGMYRLPKSSRQLCHIASFFGTKFNGSLRARFDEWHSDGAHAWVFDNETDSLNLDADVLGFDLSYVLGKDCSFKTPILMYLIHRIEKVIEGERAILFCDEGWLYLQDDYFQNLINDWSRTPRKKNNIFGLATQVANDTAYSHLTKSINESAFCKIFFPNPVADKNVYINDFGLSEDEYLQLKKMPDDQFYFLLTFGKGINKESVILCANLTGLEKEIAVISARESSLILLDQIRNEVGDDPNKLMPLFYQRIEEAAA